MDASLVMVKEDGSSKEFKLERESTIIGRDEAARLRIPLANVSRRHCEVTLDDDEELKVKDLGSSNGTYVNGRRVRQHELSPGDLLAVGPVVFVVRISGHPKDIDAKDCYMAGVVGQEDDAETDDDGPSGPPMTAPTPPLSKPTASMMPPKGKPPGGPLGKDDLADLLKDLDLDDDDEGPKPKSM